MTPTRRACLKCFIFSGPKGTSWPRRTSWTKRRAGEFIMPQHIISDTIPALLHHQLHLYFYFTLQGKPGDPGPSGKPGLPGTPVSNLFSAFHLFHFISFIFVSKHQTNGPTTHFFCSDVPHNFYTELSQKTKFLCRPE